jgi:hypothetical protein
MDARPALLSLIYRLPLGARRRALFACFNRRAPRFSDPVSFNDKVNWRILHDRRPLLEWTCDKLAMKDRAAAVAGLRIPATLWAGTDLRELASVALTEHWVLKPNHRSNLIHFGQGRADPESLRGLTAGWLRPMQSADLGEWAYSKARPLLLAEEVIGKPGSPPPDYKFFVFNGDVAAIQVDTGRHSVHRRRLYLPDWTPLEVISAHHELADTEPAPPGLDRMLRAAAKLGTDFDFIRADLYDCVGEVWFGEVTPYPGGGLDRLEPVSFDTDLGSCWKLPELAHESNPITT